MKTICAWCGCVIADGPADGPVSHGACRPCAKIVLAQMDEADAVNIRPVVMNLDAEERIVLQ